MDFRTHTGEIVTGDRLQAALSKVADDWRNLARAIRKEDRYAPHVTDATKEQAMLDMLSRADDTCMTLTPCRSLAAVVSASA